MSFSLPADMPSLNLGIPRDRNDAHSVELNETLLRHWIRRLPSNDPVAFTARYLEALQRFNANRVDHAQRLALLDLYREPFNRLLFELTIPGLQQRVRDGNTRLQLINDISAVFAELAMGYKIVIVEAGEKNVNLRLNPLAQLAVYRAVEQLSFVALHAYKFYRTLPPNLFRELHQLYLLAEHAGLADTPAFVNARLKAELSVRHRYCQILLVSICNPYGLASGDVVRSYRLMMQLAPAAELAHLPEDGRPLAGHFYINCLSDRVPAPSILPVIDAQQRPPTLVLNTKPILSLIDAQFEQARLQGEHHAAADYIRLLRQIAPYLNTSYQRTQPRLPIEGATEVFVCVGIAPMHQLLTRQMTPSADTDPWLNAPWEVLNKSNDGYLLQRRRLSLAHDLKIGDFVGIVEPPLDARHGARIASIRWLRTDEFEQTKMGLKFIAGDAMPVRFTIDDSEERLAAFLIPENSLAGQQACLLTGAGVFAAGRVLHIRTGKKRFDFSIIADSLIEQNDSYERFRFRHA